MNNTILRAISNQKMLKVVDFLIKDGKDWCKTDIARHSKVSRVVIARMIRQKILINTRGQMYQLDPDLMKLHKLY